MRRFARPAKFAALAVLIFANSTWPQTDTIYRLPVGTRIRLRMDAEINSKVSSVDDTFIAFVAKPVTNRGTIVVPEGSVVEGRVTQISRAAGGSQGGQLEVILETLSLQSGKRSIEGVPTEQFRRGSSNKFTVLSILGGTAAGALLGTSQSTSGALIGAGIGAGIGTGVAMMRKGKEFRLRKGEEFEIELRKEVLLPVLDY